MASVRLFVYGSLKRGGQHHEELRGARFLAEARTAPGFELVPLTIGPTVYTALVPAAPLRASVAGELFEVPEELLPSLDAFEGEEYVRGTVPLSSGGESNPKAAGTALAYFKKSR